MLFGFTGPAGCGKDTAADFLVRTFDFRKASFAGPLKRMLAAGGMPCPETQEEKERIIPWLGVSWRHLGQTLGTEWGRKLVHPDIWVIMTLHDLDPARDYVFSDVRFENEAKAIREKGGLVCHITDRAHAMSEGTRGHASEAGIKKLVTDYEIANGGDLQQFYRLLDGMVRYHGRH